jgi:hypothetical protein
MDWVKQTQCLPQVARKAIGPLKVGAYGPRITEVETGGIDFLLVYVWIK